MRPINNDELQINWLPYIFEMPHLILTLYAIVSACRCCWRCNPNMKQNSLAARQHFTKQKGTQTLSDCQMEPHHKYLHTNMSCIWKHLY